jgi:hypothetical protein
MRVRLWRRSRQENNASAGDDFGANCRSALPRSFNCDEAKLHAPYLNPRDAIGSDLCDLEKVAGPA